MNDFETNFTVMPKDTNYMYPLIFGGALFSHMDLCAANTVKQLLRDNDVDCNAITHKVTTEFVGPSYVGDLIELEGNILSIGKKSIVVSVKAYRTNKIVSKLLVATGEFVFVTIEPIGLEWKPDKLPCVNHNLNQDGY